MRDTGWDWEQIRVRCLREARRLTESATDADDIVQEALMRAWRMRHQCRHRPTPWALEITRNEVRRHRARRRPEAPLEEAAERERAGIEDPGCELALERLDARAALRVLSAADRAVLLLRYQEDLTQPAVAELLKVPEGTVKVRLHRARARMRAELEGET